MTRQIDSKIWVSQLQRPTGHTVVIHPSKPNKHRGPVAVQRVRDDYRPQPSYDDEYSFVEREKQATTGRWILNVIAAREAYEQTQMESYSGRVQQAPQTKKNSKFSPRKSSRVEPIDDFSPTEDQSVYIPVYPVPTKDYRNQKFSRAQPQRMLSPTTIDDALSAHSSDFSSGTSVDDRQSLSRSSVSESPQKQRNRRSDDCSTEEFKNSEETSCISKRMMIIITVIAIVLVIGIIIAVLVTIFVGGNASSSTTSNSGKSLFIGKYASAGGSCPTLMFNITDELCETQTTYRYFSCYHLVTSAPLTIRFVLDRDAAADSAWYFDDISAIENDENERIINGGFESNSTGWTIDIPADSAIDTYVDRAADFAHSGLAYLHGHSSDHSVSIQQTFDVSIGASMHVSFWWRYDGGSTWTNSCGVMGFLIA